MRYGKSLTSKTETVAILHSTEEVILSNSMFFFCQVHLGSVPWSMVGTPSDTALKKTVFFFANMYLQQKSPWFGTGMCVLFPCPLWASLSGAVCKAIALRTESCRDCSLNVVCLCYLTSTARRSLNKPPCSSGVFVLIFVLLVFYSIFFFNFERKRERYRQMGG